MVKYDHFELDLRNVKIGPDLAESVVSHTHLQDVGETIVHCIIAIQGMQ